MSNRPLSEEEIWKLLEGQVNVLAPAAKKEEEALSNTPCPNCNVTSCQIEINSAKPFSPGNILVNKILRCRICGMSFDPESKLILSPPTTESD